MYKAARILIFGVILVAAAAGQPCDVARLDVRNTTIRTDRRTFAFHNGIAVNYDAPPEEGAGQHQPDWQAEIEQDRLLRPAPNVTLRSLLIHDLHVTGSGWQYYATAFRCSNGKLQEVFQRHGLSLRIDRLSANRIDVSMMTTPGKNVRERWSYVWDPEQSRYVLSPRSGSGDNRRRMARMLQLGQVQVDESKLADLCRRYRVRELSVFGSAARGEMRPDSDVDLLVEFQPDAEIDLVDYAGLMLDLSRLLGRKVDLVSKKGLKPLIRASVLSEARLLIRHEAVLCDTQTRLRSRSWPFFNYDFHVISQ
jgi:predicted nucleotidyltransferase